MSHYRPILISCCMLLSSCGTYSFSRSSQEHVHIAIPYAQGDETGDLTNAIVSSLASRTNIKVSQDCRYELSIKILDDKKETLTYRFNHPDKRKNLVACENRLSMLAEVCIIDKYTKKCVRGPGFILGSSEYDHQHKAKSNKVNKESLGQLEDTSADREMVPTSLHKDLGAKIALWVQQQLDLMPIDKA